MCQMLAHDQRPQQETKCSLFSSQNTKVICMRWGYLQLGRHEYLALRNMEIAGIKFNFKSPSFAEGFASAPPLRLTPGPA
jgi:hypothetical protein